VAFGVIDDLREALEVDGERIAAFMIEPIQGSAGYVFNPYHRSHICRHWIELLLHRRDT
jgi:4-aminobutyrate aminotransferase-like enzyme